MAFSLRGTNGPLFFIDIFVEIGPRHMATQFMSEEVLLRTELTSGDFGWIFPLTPGGWSTGSMGSRRVFDSLRSPLGSLLVDALLNMPKN